LQQTNEFTNVPKNTMDSGKTNRQMFDVIRASCHLFVCERFLALYAVGEPSEVST